jgi:hypothetical protein
MKDRADWLTFLQRGSDEAWRKVLGGEPGNHPYSTSCPVVFN